MGRTFKIKDYRSSTMLGLPSSLRARTTHTTGHTFLLRPRALIGFFDPEVLKSTDKKERVQ